MENNEDDLLSQPLLKGQDADFQDSKFYRLNVRSVTVPEWKILLALAYKGPANMYEIGTSFGFEYPLVHRAMKSLAKHGWVRVIETRVSVKNVKTRLFGLETEGLLWLFSRLPKKVHPSVILDDAEDSLGLRKIAQEKDVAQLKDLSSQEEIYLHLLFEFEADAVAEKNASLFPLVFENWKRFKEAGAADSLAWWFPETAFSTLREYYDRYEGLFDKLGSLEMLFAYKLFQNYLGGLNTGYVNSDSDLKRSLTEEAERFLKTDVRVLELSKHILKDMKKGATQTLTFIREVEAAAKQPLQHAPPKKNS